MGPLVFPWSSLGPKKSWYIGRVIQIYKICGKKEGAFCSISKISLKSLHRVSDFSDGIYDCDFYTKNGEPSESINLAEYQSYFLCFLHVHSFCVVYLLEDQMRQAIFPFSSLRFLYILGNPGLLCAVRQRQHGALLLGHPVLSSHLRLELMLLF